MNVVFTREKKFTAGKYTEVDWYPYTDRQQHAARLPRAKRKKAQLPKIKALNDRYSRQLVRLLIEGNFTKGDYHTTLTFAEKVSDEEAQRLFGNYIKRLRNAYRRAGKELRYIYVAEHGGKRGRIHYHIIMNSGIPRDQVEQIWGENGYVNVDRLQPDKDGTFAALEKYIMKSQAENEKHRRTWNCSRNLKRPTVTTNDNSISRRRVMRMFRANADGELMRYIGEVYKGFEIIHGAVSVNEVTGFIHAEFRMRRNE